MIYAPRFLLFALVSVLAAGSGPLASEEDEVHFCQDPEGNIVLQTDPCPEPAEAKIDPDPPPPGASPAPIPEQPAAQSSAPPASWPPERIGAGPRCRCVVRRADGP
jgi:hypothetical protein